MKTLLVAYSCDAWHSHDSMRLLGVFSSMDALLYVLRYEGWRFSEDDIRNLLAGGQTQGRARNIHTESVTLNRPA